VRPPKPVLVTVIAPFALLSGVAAVLMGFVIFGRASTFWQRFDVHEVGLVLTILLLGFGATSGMLFLHYRKEESYKPSPR
jgi:uncharacterized membrane protein